MSKNMKRFLVCIMAVCILASLFAGCAPKQPAATNPSETQQGGDTTPANTDTPSAEPVDINIFAGYQASVEDYDTNYSTTYIQDKFNVKFHWDGALDGGDVKEKFNVMLNSGGELPDVFAMNNAVDNTAKWVYGEQGYFIPQNDLIEKYGENVKALWEIDPTLQKQMTSPDGNIYSLGNYFKITHCHFADEMWINQTWLDKLNLKMPETQADLEAVLAAFKNNDPNGNGKADEIPMGGMNDLSWTSWMNYFINMYLFKGNDPQYKSAINNGTVYSPLEDPKMQDAFRYMKKLYDQGLIDNNILTATQDDLRQLVMGETPAVGIICADIPDRFAPNDSEQTKEYVMMKPVAGPDGTRVVTYTPPAFGGNNWIISSDCENPDVVFQIGDFLLSDEGALLTYYGEEGVDWEPAHEGDLGMDGQPATIRPINSMPSMRTQNKCWMWMAPQKDLRFIDGGWVDPEDPWYIEYRLYRETHEKQEEFVPTDGYGVLPPLTFTSDEGEELAQISTTLDDYIKTSRAAFISGDMDVEKDWATFVQTCKDLGLDRIIEINQIAYDRQYK